MRAGLQRALLGAAAWATLTLLLGCNSSRLDSGPQPTIIFVVLDTVRSDHLSLCGYERPTSPELERLARRPGAVSTCRAYAPGDWTLPSHASFFTGRPVTEHGARIAQEGPVLANVRVSPLADSYVTLAEELAEAGYQTVAVSGNPVLAAESGLMQGFQTWYAAPKFSTLFGQPLIERVEETLKSAVDPEGGPLFLFVNLAEAHGPWRSVPESLGWIPPQKDLRLSLHYRESPYRLYLRGELDEEDLLEARKRYTDVYDVGVHRADFTLGRLLRLLRKGGWLAGHHRIVVTSDHGEFLAERGLVGHGGYLFEANNRIPLVYLDSEHEPPALTEPLSGLAPFYLARDGRLPSGVEPTAVAFPRLSILKLLGDDADRYHQTSIGLWRGQTKWVWMDGDLFRYDLAEDPGETSPQALPPEEVVEALDREIAGLAALSERTLESDESLLETLRALGYVE